MSVPLTVLTDTPARFTAVGRVLEKHVREGTTPAVCASVTDRSRDLAVWSVGRHTYAESSPATRHDDLYDLASVTKVVATATLCALLVDRGKLDLDAPVSSWVTGVDDLVTPRALLSHAAGLPAHVHLFNRMVDREEVVNAVCRMELEYEPLTRSVYSDMGYILLGTVLERLTGAPLNELFRDCVREPLGLHETVFCPGESARPRIVPTESDTRWRGRLVHGEVHDENASVMRGIAPHAGLFSSVRDCARFARLWLNEGVLDGKRHLASETIRMFRKRDNRAAGSSWALGWDTVTPGASTSGQYFSAESYGALGFTGTSIWIDPGAEIAVVLLTNRVHPTRENWGIKRLRPEFHDAVREGLM